MPFKLKLKKSRQYNVTSKSLFVISVHHLLVLDTPTTVDCTLSSESTGQECLDNVCQRLSIQQPEFFGLRYVCKESASASAASASSSASGAASSSSSATASAASGGYATPPPDAELRWVDLERPLSRQLEKHAASASRLHLRVMYYVISGVSLITDEIARNYYFLQLKADVVEARIACDQRQAVILAIYCRQAQYADAQQRERHTVDYLKQLLPFPRHMREQSGLLERLTEEVLQRPAADVQQLTQAAAEGLFIAACQQLDGYGQERFAARDDAGAEVVLGITVSGVAVETTKSKGGERGAGPAAGQAMHEFLRFYPWHDISNVVNHKRTFNIECTQPENSVGFTLADAETGRYFWKLCVLQHTFYMRYEQHHRHLPEQSATAAVGGVNIFAQAPEEPYDSRDNLFASDQQLQLQQQQQQHGRQLQHGSSGQLLAAHMYASDSHLATVGGGGGGGHQHPSVLLSSNASLAASQQQLRAIAAAAQAHQLQMQMAGGGGGGSQMQLHQSPHTQHPHLQALPHQQQQQQRAQSSSCLDLSNSSHQQQQQQQQLNNNLAAAAAAAGERERLKALLPGYRAAPDYETAVQQHGHHSSQQRLLHHHHQYANSETELRQLPPHQHANAAAAAATAAMLSDPYHLNAGAMYSGSQPDVHRAANSMTATTVADAIFGKQLQQLQQPYPDVTQTTTAAHSAQYQHQQNIARMHSMHVHQQQQQQHLHQQQQHLQQLQQQQQQQHSAESADRFSAHQQLTRFNKPPPPYAANRLSSTSTPDLAVASSSAYRAASAALYAQTRGSYVSGSSPDLVSTRTFLAARQQQQQQQYLAGGGVPPLPQQQQQPPTAAARYRYSQSHIAAPSSSSSAQYETLNAAAFHESQQQLHAAAAAYRQQYANGGSGSGSAMQLPLRDGSRSGSCEPIYENVPMANGNGAGAVVGAAAAVASTAAAASAAASAADEMRDRTSSIQSAPGVMRYNQNPATTTAAAVAMNSMAALSLHDNGDVADRGGSGGQTMTTTAVHRSVSKTSSNPIYLTQQQQKHQSEPPKHLDTSLQQTQHSDSGHSSSFGAGAPLSSTMSAPAAPQRQRHLQHHHHQLDASSLSAVSAASASTTSMMTTGADASGGASSTGGSSTATTKASKTKRRWGGFFGGSKSSLNESASKSDASSKPSLKSATLGRHKEKASKSTLALEEESNLRHRWSTGLPRAPAGPEPVAVTQMSKEKLCHLLDTKRTDPLLYREFESIPRRRDDARYECALLAENRARNADAAFLPYDDNRVHLTPQRDNRHGYVNASHVSATVGRRQRFYVVAQSPQTPATLETFLQCVWEADVYLVVQLSGGELDAELSYVPAEGSKCLEYGQYQVWQEFAQRTERCTTSKLRLYHTASRRYRSVWHLSYAEWVEPNCPRDVGHFLDFLEELNSVRLAAVNEVPPGHNSNPPVLIHCGEGGGGRSGITLAADLLLYTLDHNQDLDIPRVIGQLRQQRDNILPSLAQYKFMYALLAHYLKRTRLI